MAHSGRSLSDSATRSGRNDVTIKVTLLDGEDKTFSIDRRVTAETVINLVLTDHLDLEEKEYFSLYYLDNNHRLFLDPRKQIKKLMPNSSAKQWDLYFGVKFYAPSPDILKQDITRYLYVLQICTDIRENRILVDGDDASHLASLLLQANVGDYNLAEHKAGYSLDFLKLLYSNVDQLPSRYEFSLIDLHKEHQGLNPEQAEMKFLQKTKDLRRYGQHLFAVYDYEGVVVHVGVSCTGIQLHRGNRQVKEHTWPNIVKVSFRKRKFRIKYREPHENTDNNPVLLEEFRCGEPPASKRLWKACVEQHTFFRLSQPEAPPRRPSLLLRRGSKFRYSSGRTLEQMRQATYDTREQSVHRTYSARFGKDADFKSRTNVHCYTITKSASGEQWQLDQAVGANQYMAVVDKEVKKRQLAGNFNQQKMFALVKTEGEQMPMSNAAQKKFVIKRSDVSGKYEMEVNKAAPPSASTQQLSSWNEQSVVAPMVTSEEAQPSNGVTVSRSHDEEHKPLPLEEPIQVVEANHTQSAPYSFQTKDKSSVPYNRDDDITPELAKLDEMMNSIAREMEDDSSLAATVVNAFLKKEHTLVEQNAGGYPSIIQEVQ